LLLLLTRYFTLLKYNIIMTSIARSGYFVVKLPVGAPDCVSSFIISEDEENFGWRSRAEGEILRRRGFSCAELAKGVILNSDYKCKVFCSVAIRASAEFLTLSPCSLLLSSGLFPLSNFFRERRENPARALCQLERFWSGSVIPVS